MEMYSHRLICLLVGTLLFCSILLPLPCHAEAEHSRVNAVFNIEFQTASDFKIEVEMNVKNITAFGPMNKTQIKDAASSGNSDKIGAIKYILRQSVEDQLEHTFSPEKEDNIKNIKELPTYENGMFYDYFHVNLSAAFFSMGKISDVGDLVNGLLDVGAAVSYLFGFKAMAGWNSTYRVILPDYLKFRNSTSGGDYDESENTVSWELNNYDENAAETIEGELSIAHANPTSLVKEEKIRLEQTIDASEVQEPKLLTRLLLESIDIQKYDILPEFISGVTFVPADGIRLLNKTGLLSFDDIQNVTVTPIKQKITSSLERILNQSVELSFSWNTSTTINCSQPYFIEKMNDTPPVEAALQNSAVNFRIKDRPLRGVTGLLHAGGELNITADDLPFDELPYPHNGYLILPQNITLDGNNTYVWNDSSPIKGLMKSQIAPQYEKDEKNMTIYVEITKTDLNLLDLFKGETKLSFSSTIANTLMLHVIRKPEVFNLQDLAPDYLNADALRLIVEEKMISETVVDRFLSSHKPILKEKTKLVPHGKQANTYIDKEHFYDSLQWNRDIYHMDKEQAVNVTLRSTLSYSLPLEVSLWPPGGRVSNQSFNLSGSNEYSVSYQIVFPQGMTVQVGGNQTDVQTGVMGDGREYLSVSFAAGEKIMGTTVNCSLQVSSLFLVSIFQPCIIGAIILMIFIVIIYLLRKRRGRERPSFFRKKPWERQEEQEDYQDEEYYIPPPPPGRE